ncbi:MAG: hypothetical protein IJ740_05630 [Ruminococcus sp.]|nr:hypothetical protein [Ruminococcus sp.]
MSEEKWKTLIKEFKSSEKSQRVWCREHGVKRSTLRYWLERTDELSKGIEIRFARVVTGGDRDDSYSSV